MRTKITKSVVLVCIAVTLCSFTLDRQNAVRFQKGSWSQVSKLAKQKEMPIFIFVGAKYCHISRKMETVFAKKEVGEFYNYHFVCMRMDPTKVMENFRLTNWGISQVPCILFLDANRKIVERCNGYLDEKRIIEKGQKALAAIEDENKQTPQSSPIQTLVKRITPKNLLTTFQ